MEKIINWLKHHKVQNYTIVEEGDGFILDVYLKDKNFFFKAFIS